jgi:ribosomal protein S18 acetylase RimI-like enzyme
MPTTALGRAPPATVGKRSGADRHRPARTAKVQAFASTTGPMSSAQIRPATPADVPAIVGLIRELAEFEQLTHLVQTDGERLREHLFGARPVVEALVAEGQGGAIVGFALFFTNYSTFLAKPGIYLEDLYVQPAARDQGLGQRLLRRLAQIAVERDYGRFEWCVLDWNVDAIRFYERLGATLMPDWRLCRVTGAQLQALAG